MIETLMALNVTDAELYARYRAAMTPLLEAHGGRFGLDLWVREVLRSPTEKPFNRMGANPLSALIGPKPFALSP